MWKLKSKLKRKFRSSKIDCNSNRVDCDTLSFDSESAAQPESEQSDTSAAVPGVNGGYHGGDAPVALRAEVSGSASSENSSTLNYNSCCYNYNFHINYNVHQRFQEHLELAAGHRRHHHHHQHHHHHLPHGPPEDTDGTPYGSTSCMTGAGSESSAEPARRKRPSSCPRRKVRPVSSGGDRSMRHSAGSSSASSTKVSSEPGVGTKTLSSGGKSATRCLSTSDLSSYKGTRDRTRRLMDDVRGGEGAGSSQGAVRRPRSASQRRPARARAVDEEEDPECAPSGDYLTLCRKLHAVSLQKEATPTDLTDHDRRILHCMVLKRIKELEQLEEAVLAQQCWEQEKLFRKSLLDQQERNYRKAIRQKRTIEMIEVRNRKQRLARLEQQQIEKIQNEISEKDLRSASLLKNIEIKKGIRECERRSRELKRLEDATVNHEEKVLDRDIWRQSLVETLEERANRAEGLRRRVMDVYRRRLKIDNQLEQKMHAHNLQQTLEQERYKLSLLKERILVRESRFQKFKDSKKRIFDQLKSRAKTTAALRDMVKHSIGPSSAGQPGSASGTGGRPSSVVQRCGSSARSFATVTGSLAGGAMQPHRLLDVVRIS